MDWVSDRLSNLKFSKMGVLAVMLIPGLKQDGGEFEAALGYSARPCIKKKNKSGWTLDFIPPIMRWAEIEAQERKVCPRDSRAGLGKAGV